MRRTAKPFTVEVKKRGGRKRETGETSAVRNEPNGDAEAGTAGRGIRFRDAENLFRGAEPEAPPKAVDATPAAFARLFETRAEPPASRRILPDLIAEAAISEASIAATPEPRRRGRPPKMRTGDAAPPPARRGRKTASFPVEAPVSFFDMPDFSPPEPVVPAFLYLAASARRRAARATGNLPRGDRWKRRLPKACW